MHLYIYMLAKHIRTTNQDGDLFQDYIHFQAHVAPQITHNFTAQFHSILSAAPAATHMHAKRKNFQEKPQKIENKGITWRSINNVSKLHGTLTSPPPQRGVASTT